MDIIDEPFEEISIAVNINGSYTPLMVVHNISVGKVENQTQLSEFRIKVLKAIASFDQNNVVPCVRGKE